MECPVELLAELRPLASRVQPGRVDASRAGISTGDIQQARHATRPRNPFDK
ncbi:MAG: hypothetical protein FJ086_16730, partial [Deltaproteobacteria bacterium]|nr:hypothetical protein [Deltaproteobacteria bacterium]